jgi:hypothetical protein
MNRLRSSTSSVMCSRCASVVSYNNSRMTSRAASQLSLLQMRRTSTSTTLQDVDPEVPCKICLMDMPLREMVKLQECGCMFCKEVRKIHNIRDNPAYVYLLNCSFIVKQCMQQYIGFEVMSSAYDISCPDPECEKQGVMQIPEMEALVGKELMDKHKTFRLNTGNAFFFFSNRTVMFNKGILCAVPMTGH